MFILMWGWFRLLLLFNGRNVYYRTDLQVRYCATYYFLNRSFAEVYLTLMCWIYDWRWGSQKSLHIRVAHRLIYGANGDSTAWSWQLVFNDHVPMRFFDKIGSFQVIKEILHGYPMGWFIVTAFGKRFHGWQCEAIDWLRNHDSSSFSWLKSSQCVLLWWRLKAMSWLSIITSESENRVVMQLP